MVCKFNWSIDDSVFNEEIYGNYTTVHSPVAELRDYSSNMVHKNSSMKDPV